MFANTDSHGAIVSKQPTLTAILGIKDRHENSVYWGEVKTIWRVATPPRIKKKKRHNRTRKPSEDVKNEVGEKEIFKKEELKH